MMKKKVAPVDFGIHHRRRPRRHIGCCRLFRSTLPLTVIVVITNNNNKTITTVIRTATITAAIVLVVVTIILIAIDRVVQTALLVMILI